VLLARSGALSIGDGTPETNDGTGAAGAGGTGPDCISSDDCGGGVGSTRQGTSGR
jgi:hypothetical protein